MKKMWVLLPYWNILGHFSDFQFSQIFIFPVLRILNKNISSNCNMHLKVDIKTFNLHYRRIRYDQLTLRYARLKFFEKLSLSNQSEAYLKLCNLAVLKPIFSSNESFFKGLLFEYPVDFLRYSVLEICLFEVL